MALGPIGAKIVGAAMAATGAGDDNGTAQLRKELAVGMPIVSAPLMQDNWIEVAGLECGQRYVNEKLVYKVTGNPTGDAKRVMKRELSPENLRALAEKGEIVLTDGVAEGMVCRDHSGFDVWNGDVVVGQTADKGDEAAVVSSPLAGRFNFALDEALLTPEANAKLEALVAARPGAVFEVFGTADRAENDAYNIELSQRRINVVKAKIEGLGGTVVERAACGESIWRGAGRPDGVPNMDDRYAGVVASDGAFLAMGNDGNCTAGQIQGFQQILDLQFVTAPVGPR